MVCLKLLHKRLMVLLHLLHKLDQLTKHLQDKGDHLIFQDPPDKNRSHSLVMAHLKVLSALLLPRN